MIVLKVLLILNHVHVQTRQLVKQSALFKKRVSFVLVLRVGILLEQDILYAPNICIDTHGRTIMWGWLQERGVSDSSNYSGCLTVPRLLSIR